MTRAPSRSPSAIIVRKLFRRKQATMHPELLDRAVQEYEQSIEPVLQAYEDEQNAATALANQAAKAADEAARGLDRRDSRYGGTPRPAGIRPPVN